MVKKSEALSDESLQKVTGGLNGHALSRAVSSFVGSIFASQSSNQGQNNSQGSEKPPAK